MCSRYRRIAKGIDRNHPAPQHLFQLFTSGGTVLELRSPFYYYTMESIFEHIGIYLGCMIVAVCTIGVGAMIYETLKWNGDPSEPFKSN